MKFVRWVGCVSDPVVNDQIEIFQEFDNDPVPEIKVEFGSLDGVGKASRIIFPADVSAPFFSDECLEANAVFRPDQCFVEDHFIFVFRERFR